MLQSPSSAPTPSISATTDVVVIGCGPSGLFALFQLGSQGLACHALDALPHPGGQCAELYPDKPIYDIPGLCEVSGMQLAEQLRAQLNPFDIQWHWGQTVQAIDDSEDGWLIVRTEQNTMIRCKAVVIAIGVGAFVPRKPKMEGLEAQLNQGTQVFLQSHDHAAPIAQRSVLIHGGDEAAVAKAIALAKLPEAQRPSRITLLHRRNVFKAPEADLAQLQTLREQGRIHVAIGQAQSLQTNTSEETASLQAVQILDSEGQAINIPCETLLIYQGISPKLGAALEWGLTLESKHIQVRPDTFQTNRRGIYAIGDITTYPGKRKLIACGFHEATLAAYAITEFVRNKPQQTLYTTTSTLLLERLGKLPAESE